VPFRRNQENQGYHRSHNENHGNQDRQQWDHGNEERGWNHGNQDRRWNHGNEDDQDSAESFGSAGTKGKNYRSDQRPRNQRSRRGPDQNVQRPPPPPQQNPHAQGPPPPRKGPIKPLQAQGQAQWEGDRGSPGDPGPLQPSHAAETKERDRGGQRRAPPRAQKPAQERWDHTSKSKESQTGTRGDTPVLSVCLYGC